MKKFLALYLTSPAMLENWMKTDPEERKASEAKMRVEWQDWMRANASHIVETAGAGATKRITKEGAADAKNNIMMFSIVEAESAEEAAKLFIDHPHLGIPESSIEVMPANFLPGME